MLIELPSDVRLKDKKQWLHECELMLAYYKGEPNPEGFEFATCIFCEHIRSLNGDNPFTRCSDCIWLYMEGFTCYNWASFNGFKGGLLNSYRKRCDKAWVAVRIPMLERWIEQLKKEIVSDQKVKQKARGKMKVEMNSDG